MTDSEFEILNIGLIESFEIRFEYRNLYTALLNVTYAHCKFYNFTVYGADGSPIVLVGNQNQKIHLARYNDEFSPFTYIDENRILNNLMLVPVSHSRASNLILKLTNENGEYPSEKIRQYAENFGLSNGIGAVAIFAQN